jgi:hypothetical protein
MILMERNNDAARAECYQAVRDCMKDGIQGYYREYPERLLDERSTLAIEWSLKGLQRVFTVLDRYLIGYQSPDE